jgi:hypothetical protein
MVTGRGQPGKIAGSSNTSGLRLDRYAAMAARTEFWYARTSPSDNGLVFASAQSPPRPGGSVRPNLLAPALCLPHQELVLENPLNEKALASNHVEQGGLDRIDRSRRAPVELCVRDGSHGGIDQIVSVSDLSLQGRYSIQCPKSFH